MTSGIRARDLTGVQELCRRLPPHLTRHQGLRHQIFIVNQTDSKPFNRGALVNAAVQTLQSGTNSSGRAARRRRGFDYLAIHDADRFPVNTNRSDCNMHTASYYTFPAPTPRVLNPDSFAGGVLVLSTALYRAVNGFSNEYWGWGEEDNDLFLRLRWCGLPPKHGDALERCMEHNDCVECKRHKERSHGPKLAAHTARLHARLPNPRPHMLRDGLSTLNFTLDGINHRRCGAVKVIVLQISLLSHAAHPS